ncbi:hypothetical protein GCM10018772_08220 [Streptomyces fumanus]|uniref:Uncharacterized protein n=1 Tax=Streptomyces fumanus TaxID=67302 RepID=A0A919DWY4_9ACTN|nr:hypothetical protein GCM10018772_08220 [Streptomyces fumanus]
MTPGPKPPAPGAGAPGPRPAPAPRPTVPARTPDLPTPAAGHEAITIYGLTWDALLPPPSHRA